MLTADLKCKNSNFICSYFFSISFVYFFPYLKCLLDNINPCFITVWRPCEPRCGRRGLSHLSLTARHMPTTWNVSSNVCGKITPLGRNLTMSLNGKHTTSRHHRKEASSIYWISSWLLMLFIRLQIRLVIEIICIIKVAHIFSISFIFTFLLRVTWG